MIADQQDTLAAIARHLGAEGVPTKRGGRWYPATVPYLLNIDLYAAEEVAV